MHVHSCFHGQDHVINDRRTTGHGSNILFIHYNKPSTTHADSREQRFVHQLLVPLTRLRLGSGPDTTIASSNGVREAERPGYRFNDRRAIGRYDSRFQRPARYGERSCRPSCATTSAVFHTHSNRPQSEPPMKRYLGVFQGFSLSFA